MKKFFLLLWLIIFLSTIGFSYAQIDTAKFKLQIFLRTKDFIVNPFEKINYKNNLLNFILINMNLDKKSRHFYLQKYLALLDELKKDWRNISFSYSQYKTFYQNSVNLYINHYKFLKNKIKDQTAEKKIIELLALVSKGADSREYLSFIKKKIKDIPLEEQNFILNFGQSKEEITSKININELNEITKKLKKLIDEFNSGKRILTISPKIAEKKIKEIQNSAEQAKMNIIYLDIDTFNKNIELMKKNIEFLYENSKIVP